MCLLKTLCRKTNANDVEALLRWNRIPSRKQGSKKARVEKLKTIKEKKSLGLLLKNGLTKMSKKGMIYSPLKLIL